MGTAKRWRTTKWHGLDNFECNHCAFSSLDKGAMVNHVRGAHPTEAEGRAPLGVTFVTFASEAAEAFADVHRITGEMMAATEATGQTGYTLGDVRRVAASANIEED